MDLNEFKNPKKEKRVSIRVTKEDFYLLKKKKVSPARLFDKILQELKKK